MTHRTQKIFCTHQFSSVHFVLMVIVYFSERMQIRVNREQGIQGRVQEKKEQVVLSKWGCQGSIHSFFFFF